MSHLHSDPGFAGARLAEALHELVDTYGPLPDHDIHGGLTDWRLLLVPPTTATDVVPTGPATVTVDVGLDVTLTVTAGARPTEGAVGIEENPYAIPLPPEILRPLTRLLMDLVYTEEHSAREDGRGVCQLCGKGRALSIWRPR
ncbi:MULTISPECIES: hypothetical protein [Streptomyces]|uniref:hypothetical protein n=1 Tax=Streptomyces TaxID=1883 RepID=UPI0022576BE7|nr:hypothetical protein [Streptomyces virginiae]MCX5278325.1 hypothetical protein [Streptomyces virginiae]